jgi:HK97 family phage major capsid protein
MRPEPETLAEIAAHYRGWTPEQLEAEADRLDVRLRLLHKDKKGKARLLDDEEQHEFDITVAARDTVVEAMQQHADMQRGFKRGGNALSAYHGLRVGDDSFYSGGDVLRMEGKQVRTAALRALEHSGKRLAPTEADRVEVLIADGGNEDEHEAYIARRILLTENPAYRSAWRQLMTEPHPLLDNEEIEAVRAFKKFERLSERAASEGVTTAGGFGIPVFIDPSIILTAQGSGNDFLTIAKVAEVNTNAWKGVTSAGVTWAFQAEGSAAGDNAPLLGQPAITVFMARGFIPYSIEIGQDYPQFADEMAVLLGSGYDELLIDKFSRGSGSGEPQGIITGLDGVTTPVVQTRLTTAGAFGDIDVYNVWKALPQRFRRKASWMMSVGTNNGIRRMGTSSLSHAYTTNLVGETIDKLMNRQVYESVYFPDVVNTTGHYNQLVVGDFNQYVIARRGGMNTELVPTLFDITNNRPTGQRGWFAYARIGGGVANPAGFQILNQT